MDSHIKDHLTVAKLGAIAINETFLVHLIDMALLHEAQRTKKAKPDAPSKVA